MTINTKDHRPGAKSDIAIKRPIASATPPEPGGSSATAEPELASRVKVRRVELVARLRELRMDTRQEAGVAGDRLKAKLSELALLLKEGVADDWANLGENAKRKLEHWLAESARQLPVQGASKGGQS